jgi:hypothetical protein
MPAAHRSYGARFNATGKGIAVQVMLFPYLAVRLTDH